MALAWRLMSEQELRHIYDHIFGANEDLIADKDIMGQTFALFIRKAAGYGGTAVNFGSTGELVEISRKYWKLFGILMEGKDPGAESAEEICMDMVGHLLLMIYHLRQEDKPLREVVDNATHYATPGGTVIGARAAAMCTCGGTGNSCPVHPLHRHGPGA